MLATGHLVRATDVPERVHSRDVSKRPVESIDIRPYTNTNRRLGSAKVSRKVQMQFIDCSFQKQSHGYVVCPGRSPADEADLLTKRFDRP